MPRYLLLGYSDTPTKMWKRMIMLKPCWRQNTRGDNCRKKLGFSCNSGPGTTLEENLHMIADTVAYLKAKGLRLSMMRSTFDGF